MLKKKDSFMDWVQLHERAWGSRSYAGRPSLEAIMQAPVVTFWRTLKEGKRPPYTIKLYQDLKDVERYLTRLIFRSSVNPPQETLARIYANQKRITVRAVRILFQEVNEDD
ncbi:MAG TPA: hypothetical protein VK003_12030 [Oceanobacillus sp.]|nr:hypothetical protein [Oceanobacillus sp.]